MERPKVNLDAFARDPVYFAVAHRACVAPAGSWGGDGKNRRGPKTGSPRQGFREGPGTHSVRTTPTLFTSIGARRGPKVPKKRTNWSVERFVARSESRTRVRRLRFRSEFSCRVAVCRPPLPPHLPNTISGPFLSLPSCVSFAFLSLSLFYASRAHGSDPESSTALPRMAPFPLHPRVALCRILLLLFLFLSLPPPPPRSLLLRHPLAVVSLLPFVAR